MAGLVSRVCPGGPHIISTVDSHGLEDHTGIYVGPSQRDSTTLDAATIILNQ